MDTQEVTAVPAQEPNPALVQLVSIQDNVTIPDMNYQFSYQRVKKPNSNDSHLFALHYKSNQQEDWSTARNLLSESFTVAKTEIIIQQIQANLGGEIVRQKHFRSDTSVKASFVLAGYGIDVHDDNDMNKLLFKLITNITTGIDVITQNNLSFNIINGFSGNHALQLNYGILKVLKKPDSTEVTDEVPVNNVFILDQYTKRLIHNTRLNITIEDVTNVQRSISQQIELYRSLEANQAFIDGMFGKFPKRFMKKFGDMYNGLPMELRNMYYVTYLISACLDTENKVDLEIKLRSYIAEKIHAMVSARERMAREAAAAIV